jgi:hypothetical protein
MTLMLLVAHFLALAVAVMVFGWVIFLHRRNRAAEKLHPRPGEFSPTPAAAGIRPATWLAVRSLEPATVRATLPDKKEFSISPRVNGWVIVTGRGLPDPGDDVDGCFRFLTFVSRKLGHVQFFHMEKYSAHHAWARMDDGCVTRAYAWAGETIWDQGAATLAENRLGLKCSGYGEDAETGFWAANENAAANVEKIPLLAARWSLDPGILHRANGITGESSRLY